MAENKIQEKAEEIKPGEKYEMKEGMKEQKQATVEEKKADKKQEVKVEKIKKESASAKGLNLHMSTKEAADICDMIRNKEIDTAIKMIEEVMAFKRVVKMNKREVPHKHGKGIMAGRYPIKSAGEFLRMLKQLKANAMHHELELEKYIISCKADRASQPYRRGGRRFKRTHLTLILEKNMKLNKKGVKKK